MIMALTTWNLLDFRVAEKEKLLKQYLFAQPGLSRLRSACLAIRWISNVISRKHIGQTILHRPYIPMITGAATILVQNEHDLPCPEGDKAIYQYSWEATRGTMLYVYAFPPFTSWHRFRSRSTLHCKLSKAIFPAVRQTMFNYSDALRITYSYQRDFKCSSSGLQ